MNTPSYVLFVDVEGKWRWRLVARNGEPIAQSEGYKTERMARKGIASCRRNAPIARVDNRSPAPPHS